MAAPDRNKLHPFVDKSVKVTKRVSMTLEQEHVEAAITEWLTRHYAEFRNMELTFDHDAGYGKISVIATRETSK